MKILNKLFRYLVYALPVVLFFSYYPVITFGASDSMNFEFSLPLLWLVVFDFLAVILLVQKWREVINDLARGWKWLLFPILVTLSVLWSANVVRGVLTVGILWLIMFAVYSIIKLKKILYDERGFYYVFLRVFFGFTLVICAWCILQCVLDIVGVPRENTLLCRGCTLWAFGFPHPNGFAIEPQFMGNLLLAPTILATWLYVDGQANKNLRFKPSRGRVFYNRSGGPAPKLQFRTRTVTIVKNTSGSGLINLRFLLACLFIFAVTLFLTFSRGAIYAFVIALIFMTVFLWVRRKHGQKNILRRVGMVWGIIVLAFVFTLNLQGVMAQVSPTNDTYFTGISKVLNHLSLGIIDIRANGEQSVDETTEVENESAFDGYVEESTNVRMEMTKNALKIWSRDFKTVMFGVGIGGAGQAMYDEGLTWSPKEIVQNEYASLLAEIGVVGVLIAILAVFMIVKILIKNPVNIVILTIMVAYGISLLFFSGFANALNIYLLPPVIYIVINDKNVIKKLKRS